MNRNLKHYPISMTQRENNQGLDNISSLIRVLKTEKLLKDEFLNETPKKFFNVSPLSLKFYIEELFSELSHPKMQQEILKELDLLFRDLEVPCNLVENSVVMTFAQLCLYKIFPCCESNCPNKPRFIVTQNNYQTNEYKCPFQHHERDKRRLIFSHYSEKAFLYTFFYHEGRTTEDPLHCSQNYFESMFHPLYYKLFACKNDGCTLGKFCPRFHNETEKEAWNRTFKEVIGKERVAFMKVSNDNSVKTKPSKARAWTMYALINGIPMLPLECLQKGDIQAEQSLTVLPKKRELSRIL